MPLQTVAARIRGFICLNAHPAGCAENVRAQIEIARRGAPGVGLGDALVVGASTGSDRSMVPTFSSSKPRPTA